MKKRHRYIFYYYSASYLKLEQMVIEASDGIILKCAEWLSLAKGAGDGEKKLRSPTAKIYHQPLWLQLTLPFLFSCLTIYTKKKKWQQDWLHNLQNYLQNNLQKGPSAKWKCRLLIQKLARIEDGDCRIWNQAWGHFWTWACESTRLHAQEVGPR